MKNYRRSFLGLISVSLILSGCTEPGETTTIGAATGGVIGAGLGAIVGNQTGNPGAGLVIGSIAGAGAGAAFGNTIEAQQKAVRTQDEAIERQQKMLAAQNAELRELKNMQRDETKSSINGAFKEEFKLNERPAKTNRSANSASTTEDLNRSDIKAPAIKRNVSQQPSDRQLSSRQPARILPMEARAAIKPEILAPARQVNIIQERNLEVKQPVAMEPEIQVAKQVEISASPKSPECEKADSEAEKGSSSKEPADRLFYLRRAIRLCPSNAVFHKDLADEYARLGRNEDAKTAYEDALKLDPALSDAKKSLETVSTTAY